MIDLLQLLIVLAVVGCGLIAGTFFVFSVAVMKALARLPSPAGIAAMQTINVVIVNPLFVLVFLGTALACVLIIVLALLRWGETGGVYLLLGSVLYLLGGFLVTALRNVPMNNTLASLPASEAVSHDPWVRYLAGWTAWNHVRTAACTAAMVLLMAGALS